MMLVGAGGGRFSLGMFLCARHTQTFVSYPSVIFLCSRGIIIFIAAYSALMYINKLSAYSIKLT